MIRGDEPWAWTKRPVPVADSGGGCGRRPGDLVPDREAVGHHLSVVGRRQQVPTGPKVRRDAAERRQESLRVPDRLEAFHRPLALPGRLVRALGAVVQVLRPAMLHRGHELAVRRLIASALVGDQHPRYPAAWSAVYGRTAWRPPRFGPTGPKCRARCRAGRPRATGTAVRR